MLAGGNLCGDGRPLHYEGIAAHQLKHKDDDVHATMTAVTTGTRTGRRDASPNGIRPPKFLLDSLISGQTYPGA